jgi:predicted patatin/cPLA2 family phospholipase
MEDRSDKKVKRGLVVGAGGFRGFYDAGVLAAWSGQLPEDFFDVVYASSAGVVPATFFAAGGLQDLMGIWKEHLKLNRLFGISNLLLGRPLVDSDHAVELFQQGPLALNRRRLLSHIPNVVYVLTDWETGGPRYVNVTQDTVFDLMKAALAVPYFHKPVKIENTLYIDGGLSDPLPLEKAFADGCDEVWVVYNKQSQFFSSKRFRLVAHIVARVLPKHIKDLVHGLPDRFNEIENMLQNNVHIHVIRPQVTLPLTHIFDSHKGKIEHIYHLGLQDAEAFMNRQHLK